MGRARACALARRGRRARDREWPPARALRCHAVRRSGGQHGHARGSETVAAGPRTQGLHVGDIKTFGWWLWRVGRRLRGGSQKAEVEGAAATVPRRRVHAAAKLANARVSRPDYAHYCAQPLEDQYSPDLPPAGERRPL